MQRIHHDRAPKVWTNYDLPLFDRVIRPSPRHAGQSPPV